MASGTSDINFELAWLTAALGLSLSSLSRNQYVPEVSIPHKISAVKKLNANRRFRLSSQINTAMPPSIGSAELWLNMPINSANQQKFDFLTKSTMRASAPTTVWISIMTVIAITEAVDIKAENSIAIGNTD